MDNQQVHALLGATPVMTLAQANALTALISEHNVHDVLELGFAHGVSTCYIAAALARSGGGKVVTIDRVSAKKREPNIEELLNRIGERSRVTIYYEPTSYNWRLMKILEQDPTPRFDLCYLDGAHSWAVDALAFFLVDLLLKPGGWIIFDDLDWTFAGSPSLANTPEVKSMPEDERTTPQIRKIFEVLVKKNPRYGNFMEENGWAFAQKRLS